jgi:hypothetical protein
LCIHESKWERPAKKDVGYDYSVFGRYYFAKKFKYIIHASHKNVVPVSHTVEGKGWRKRFAAFFTPTNRKVVDGKVVPQAANRGGRPGIGQRLTTDMVHRIDTTPKLVNPSGNILDTHFLSSQTQGSAQPNTRVERDHGLSAMQSATFHCADESVPHSQMMPQASSHGDDEGILSTQARERFERCLSDPGTPLRPFSLKTGVPLLFDLEQTLILSRHTEAWDCGGSYALSVLEESRPTYTNCRFRTFDCPEAQKEKSTQPIGEYIRRNEQWICLFVKPKYIFLYYSISLY